MSVASIVPVLWAVFIAYWILSAFFVKKDVHNEWPRASLISTRILFALAAILLMRATRYLWPGTHGGDNAATNSPRVYAGVLVCVAGLAFAVWARRHLGRNWSGTPSLKAEHELVTTGPYRFVRHPIYTGILVGLLGTALAMGIQWLAMLLMVGAVYGARVRVEERLMMQRFPDAYPAYRRRTKALIPFII